MGDFFIFTLNGASYTNMQNVTFFFLSSLPNSEMFIILLFAFLVTQHVNVSAKLLKLRMTFIIQYFILREYLEIDFSTEKKNTHFLECESFSKACLLPNYQCC